MKKYVQVSSCNREISLLPNLINFSGFQIQPNFIIKTNNSSGNFNKIILSAISTVIAKFLQGNPNETQYQVSFDDSKNFMSKFEKLCLGKYVKFDNNEINTYDKIAKKLSIVNSLIKKDELGNYSIFGPVFNSCLTNPILQTFTIRTKKSEYKCNPLGVRLSPVIRQFLQKEPEADLYVYDYNDDDGQFQFIADIFNFKSVKMTQSNLEFLIEIFNDLKIDNFLKNIENFKKLTEQMLEFIDEHQSTADKVEELFDSLYNIKYKTVNSVTRSIKLSNWSKSQGAVYELASFIFQVIQTDIQYHDYLIDLLLNLNENDEKNNLNTLLPFIIEHSIFLFSEEMGTNNRSLIFPFVYNLYRREIIPKERILRLMNLPFKNSFFISWFLPELVEKNQSFIIGENKIIIIDEKSKTEIEMIEPFNQSNIEEYKKMRDKGENNDDIAKSLRNDDIDVFQSIVSKNPDILLKGEIRQNMFEVFINDKISFLNYAAAYGSVKCFKYMLLNNVEVDQQTFEMSIIGGNSELIRIVDNEKFAILNQSQNDNFLVDSISHAIVRHKNDLFDWMIEQKYEDIKNNLHELFLCSIKSCNIYALFRIIDIGFNLHNYSRNEYYEIALENGFVTLLNLLMKLININNDILFNVKVKFYNYFGNFEIFKMFEKNMSKFTLQQVFLSSISFGLLNFVKYFLDKEQFSKIDEKLAIEMIKNCSKNDSKEILNIVIEKVESLLKSIKIIELFKILRESLINCNSEISKIISEHIYQKNIKTDFTEAFILASKNNLIDVIQFYIENKYQIKFFDIIDRIDGIRSTPQIYSLIMKNIDPSIIEETLNFLINKAFSKSNMPLIKYILNDYKPSGSELTQSIKIKNIELIDLILEKNSEPSYINKYTEFGNALIIATQENQANVVKKLLSIPGIDPIVYDNQMRTPLIIAASKNYNMIFNLILEFLSENKVIQNSEIRKLIKIFINDSFDNNKQGITSVFEGKCYSNSRIYKPFKSNKNNTKNKNNNNETINLNLNELLLNLINMNCIDPNLCFQNGTLLSLVCQNNLIEALEKLIEYDSIDVNLAIPDTGETPLITAIKSQNLEIIELLIKNPKININQKNYEEHSPLVFASAFDLENVVKLIIENENFDKEESDILLAFDYSKKNISKLLLSAMDDVNCALFEDGYISSISIKKTPLIMSIQKNDIELFDLVINHPSFHKSESVLVDAINVSILNDNFNKRLLEMLKEYGIDINSPIYNGKTALFEAIQRNASDQFILQILNNPDFDRSKNDILEAFKLSYSHNIFEKDSCRIANMDLLYKYDCEHDQLINKKMNEEGSHFLSSMYSAINNNRIIDINSLMSSIDNNNINGYPLQIAIEKNSYILAHCLINTKSINFKKIIQNKNSFIKLPNININVKFSNSYYIHMAAILGCDKILDDILSNHLCDINMTNYAGETALMDACKGNQIECIKVLFKYDDLDFKHRNKDGDDAIDLTRKIIGPLKNDEAKRQKNEISNKDEYLAELLRLMEIMKQKYTTQKSTIIESGQKQLYKYHFK